MYIYTIMRKSLLIIVITLCCTNAIAQGEGAAIDYLNFYQKYLSPLKHTHCRMYPSCSAYAKMVFATHSFPEAMVLTSDRLIRCGHDTQYYAKTHITGNTLSVDYPEGVKVPDCVISMGPILVSAQNFPASDSLDLCIGFVHHLINQANYYGALAEIERLQFFYPQGFADSDILMVDKMKCYEGLGDYSKGILYYNALPQKMRDSYKVLYTYAHLLDLSGNDALALNAFERSSVFMPQGESVSPYGELAILYLKQCRYQESIDCLEKKYAVDGIRLTYEKSKEVVNKASAQRMKNPGWALALSIIPGCGYFYAGSPSSAITALILNGVLSYATYTSFRSDNYGVGFILGALNLSFYIGNMVGSKRSAERYNANLKRSASDELRKLNPYIN